MIRSLLTYGTVAALALTHAACSSPTPTASEEAKTPTTAADHAGAHRYQCPMHPEVVSDKPGTCPKCGMTLEHADDPTGSGRTFQMQLAATPSAPAAGQSVKLVFRPQDSANPAVPVPLALVHEKKMHLIIVSKDLKEFYHEHPEFGADGAYTTTFTFPQGGEYLLFQDYQPEGEGHQLGRQTLTVSGAARPAVTFGADALTWTGGDPYAASLTTDQPAQVGRPLMMQAKLTYKGQPITDLAPYLGAMGHMVVLSEDAKQYLHVHPQEQAGHGPEVAFQTQFEQPGRYRVFFQFNHAGQVHTADFVLNVAPASGATRAAAGTAKAAYICPMGCEGSASDKPGACPMCGMALEKTAS
jgi:plastocyanin